MKTHIYLLKDGEHPHVCFVMLESNVYGFFTERSIDSFSQLDQYICIGRMLPFMKPLRRSDYNLTLKDSRIFEGLRRDELYETALQTDYVDFTAKASQASFMQSLTLSTLNGQSSTGG